MNTLLNKLNDHFGYQNVVQSEKHDGVYVCEKKTLNNITYQVAFIDTSERWHEEDHAQYLEKVVIEKYFKNEGFLQWNFYYYIITTKEKITEYSSIKRDIEADETYSRKTVLTEEEFTDWIDSFESISKISDDAISNDLYTNWVNYLREKQLYFVFNSEKYPNYKQPVEDYINGLTSEDIEESEQYDSINNSEPVLNKIKHLDLSNQFREYPLTKSFDLGSVNLIHGANAVGKTSFFDAIELIVTGKLFYKETNDDYNIQLTTDSDNVLKFPTRSTLYKTRDNQWYSSGSNRGNELNEHFNKFNYFTSDAAFQLKQDDTRNKNNLEEIIADIALGREVNKLEERLRSFADRFATSEEYIFKQSTRLNEELAEKNKIIQELSKQQKNPEGYKKALAEALSNNFWKSTIGDSEDTIAKLDNEIQIVNDTLYNIQSKNIELSKISLESVEKELKELNQKKTSIWGLKNEILKQQQQRQLYSKEIDKNKNILPVLDELSEFYKHENFDKLFGLDINISQKNIELNRAKEIKQLSDSILSNELFTKEAEKTIKNLEEEIKAKEEELDKKYKETELKISQIEEGIEELSIIVSNIKSSGQSYIKLNPGAEDCPLCNSHFSNNELAHAIERTQETFTNSFVLISLKEDLEFISKRLNEIDKKLETIKVLKKLAFSLFPNSGLEKQLKELQTSCIENTQKLSELTESLIQLNTIQSQFNNSNIKEVKINSLLNKTEDFLSIKIQSESELSLQKQKIINRQSVLTSANIQIVHDILEKQSTLRDYFTADIKDEEQLLIQLNTLQEIESNLKQLAFYLDFPTNTFLTTILEKTSLIRSVFETYKKAVLELKQHKQSLELTKKEIEKILAEIATIKPKQSRAQFANKELNKILVEQSKNDFLSEYIFKNKSEIVSIFKLIHTPREFKDINFKDNKITLITNENQPRTLSEISTGQRSALALSIFLSLNKKLSKGPNILMFDDPVTYVDDMNILSFFDYLRELVIKSKRQVFFATANDDIAFLFRKKFEFLANELVKIKLERKFEDILPI
jgi:DNA repair protein SbcC/Rad50